MTSWQAKLARKAISKVLSDPESPLEEQRAAMDRLSKLPRPKTATAEEISIAGVRCLHLTPTGSVSERQLIYLHGGGYVLGSPESHANWVQWFGVRANAVVTLVDYRLAPEHPYPAAIDDCTAVAQAVLAEHPAHEVTIAGDSAGGGATLATLGRLRDTGGPMPAAAVVFSPWTDLTASGESVQTRQAVDPMIEAKWLMPFADMYRGDVPADHPEVSPLFNDFTGFPPTLIQVGDHEVLLDDSVRLAHAMQAAGVTVELEVTPEMWHVYQALAPMVPEAKDALIQAAEFLSHTTRGHVAPNRTGASSSV